MGGGLFSTSAADCVHGFLPDTNTDSPDDWPIERVPYSSLETHYSKWQQVLLNSIAQKHCTRRCDLADALTLSTL